MIAAGANPRIRAHGLTMLHVAGNRAVAQLLIAKGLAVDAVAKTGVPARADRPVPAPKA